MREPDPETYIDRDYLARGASQAETIGLRDTDHPAEAKTILAMVSKQYDWANSYLTRVYARTVEAMLWFVGQHNLRVDPSQPRFVKYNEPQQIPRPVINLMLEKVESVVGDLCKGIVAGRVIPNSNDPRMRFGARNAQAIREFKWDKDHMDEKQMSVVQGCVIAGDMFTLSEIDVDNSEMQEISFTDENGAQQTQHVSLADVQTRVISGLQIFANPSATDVYNAKWLHLHPLQSTEMLREQFPQVAKLIGAGGQPENPITNWQYRIQQLMREELSSTGFSYYSQQQRTGWQYDSIEKQSVCHEVLFKPSSLYPKGRMFLVAAGAVLYAGPLREGFMGVTQLKYSPVEGCFHSLGLVHPLIPLNRHVESAEAQNTLARKVASIPMFFVPQSAQGSFGADRIKAQVGGIYTYKTGDHGEKPELVQGHHPADAGHIASMQMFLQEYMERVSGQKQVLLGERPEGVSAGVALRQLIQRASVRFAPKLNRVLRHHEILEEYRLRMIALSPAWQMPQMVSLPGRAGRQTMKYLTAADMRDNYRYRIETEPKAAQDEVSRAQTVLDGVKMGLINVQMVQNRIKILDVMGIGDEGFKDQNSVDYRHAERRLARILDGEEAALQPYDNYKIHYEVMLDYMKSDEFEDQPQEVQQAIIMRIQALQQRIMMVAAGTMHRQSNMMDMADAIAGGEPTPPPGMLPGPGGAGSASPAGAGRGSSPGPAGSPMPASQEAA